ncbi:putative bifunctional diguanylate cyclase/phosphodiesterase [Roseateles sp. DC23W]|uniref:Bifunctional diguanylate cyclase/phosphodiesterase n=1 Tax=Pelomonas dachongensis TaxID=3299029 RepID=A0ABW7EPM1_9BURK
MSRPARMARGSAPAAADAAWHAVAFREIWQARLIGMDQAQRELERWRAAQGDDPGSLLALRLDLMTVRLAPQGVQASPRYLELAARLQASGDRDGAVIASSLAMGTAAYGGDVLKAVATFEQLLPEIDKLADPLERSVALWPALYLYQTLGNPAAYLRHANQLLVLARSMGHKGMCEAASANLGIALYLAGDELAALRVLKGVLDSSGGVGGWIRFSAVACLAGIHHALGNFDKVLPLLSAWAFPSRQAGLDPEAVNQFHALGAEVHARLGRLDDARRCLAFVEQVPPPQRSYDVRCQLALSRAMYLQALGQPAQARLALDEAVQLSAFFSASHRVLDSHYWRSFAQLARDLGDWQAAYGHLDRYRELEQQKKTLASEARRMVQLESGAADIAMLDEFRRDPLTGLANREQMRVLGDEWLARQRAEPVVLMLNLRRFNAINEALGHEVGDAVLVAVADRLRAATAVFGLALVARVYADQFALAVPRDDGDASIRQLAATIFAAPLSVRGHLVDISAAWGVAMAPAHGTAMQQLMSNAEIALHQDRQSGTGWTLFSPQLRKASARQLSLVSELRRAAQEDEFELLLQPKFALADDRVTGAEALIRWNHPARGTVPPVEFIPFAEDIGAIRGITDWVLRRAMQITRELQQARLACQIAVNVSAHDIAAAGFGETLQRLLAETGARATDIRLELTESVVMNDPQQVAGRMRDISAMGFEWSIDDFGTGQSSLSYLHRLPLHELKIDRSFVRNAGDSKATITLLKAAIDLGANLGLSTVAEGAETQQEWDLLRQLGCDAAQGWLRARPMAVDAFLRWLAARR